MLWPVVAAVMAAVVTAGVMWFVMRGNTPGTTPVSAPSTSTGQDSTGTGSGEPGETGEPTEGASDEPTADPEESGGTGGGAKEQAQAVDDLLSDSGGARSGLGPALTSLRECSDTDSAISTVQRVTDARREQVEKIGSLQVDAFTDGEGIKERLTSALQASLDADESFLTWGRRRAGDCDSDWTGDPDYQSGLSSSTKATSAKEEFLALWNPVAEEHGLPTRAPHEI
ncbi:hypothetical protein [Spongiactinospora sp. TRM90649]|uniref:hypothetical protein n=1 Tax=Spongiactinospora sp. TRM90649 TaxID=3031114 RepID=UPI0023F7D4C7|nr:hypothetical protein [Spongiactinospora sp. TRM90649]MDF5754106.1 hypothetical protein [Spongiactinospora sp. TRM90649]